MAILAATEHRTVDGTTVDCYVGATYVCPCVEQDTLVTLSRTKHVAGDGVSSNLFQCTRYAERTARHRNRAVSCPFNQIAFTVVGSNVGMLIATIDRGQNVTTFNIHISIAAYGTCLTMPLA